MVKPLKTQKKLFKRSEIFKLLAILGFAQIGGSAFAADVVGNIVKPPAGSWVSPHFPKHYGGGVWTPNTNVRNNQLIYENIHFPLPSNPAVDGYQLYGGYTYTGNTTGNVVRFTHCSSCGNHIFSIYGGYTLQGVAEENSVKFSSGPNGQSFVYGGWAADGNAYRNRVEVFDSQGLQEVVGAHIGYLGGNAEGNEVRISNTTIKGTVSGAFVEYSVKAHTVRGNKVELLGSTINGRDGNYGKVTGGESNGLYASVLANEVFIRDSNIYNVSGGRVRTGTVAGNKVILENVLVRPGNQLNPTYIAGGEIFHTGTVYGNSVEINGNSEINGYVAGGFSLGSVGGNPDIRDNTVNLKGRIKVTDSVYGGVIVTHVRTPVNDRPNKLSMTGLIKAGNIDGFSDLDLNVSSVNELTASNSEYVLTLTKANELDLTGRTLNILDADPSVPKDPNKKYGLIKLQNAQPGAVSAPIKLGIVNRHSTFTTTKYDLKNTLSGELYLEGSSVVVPPNPNPNPSPNPGPTPVPPDSKGNVIPGVKTTNKNADVLLENRLASLALINSGAQFVADSLVGSVRDQIVSTDLGTKDQMYGKYLFAAGEGGTNRFGRGSHRFDLNGGSMITGGMSNVNGAYLGGFFEASWGHAISKQTGISAKGNIQSYGFGLLFFKDLTERLTVDGSVRLGYLSNRFKGIFYRFKDEADYKTQGLYTSLHLGANYDMPLAEQLWVTLYGRYIFSYLDGDKERIGKGRVIYKAKDASSHTIDIGAKAKVDLMPNIKLVGGLGVMQTMGGHAKGSIDGAVMNRISINGTTGFSELQLQGRPSEASPWQFDVGIKGYAGARSGVIGNGRISYRF